MIAIHIDRDVPLPKGPGRHNGGMSVVTATFGNLAVGESFELSVDNPKQAQNMRAYAGAKWKPRRFTVRMVDSAPGKMRARFWRLS